MKGKTIFGALLVSVALSGQGFGFELLDRMLGLDCGCCEPAACEPAAACCEPAAACCEPAAKCCEPAAACCEPAACDPCGKSKCRDKCCCRPTPVRDLFAGLQDLLECNTCCGKSCGQKGCCEPAAKCCEPAAACCEPAAKCCEPAAACCEPAAACCEPAACDPCGAKCCKKKCCRPTPLRDWLDNILGCCKSNCCKSACCAPAGCGCGEAEAADAAGNGAEAPGELPRAPDPSASLQRTRGIYQASVARN